MEPRHRFWIDFGPIWGRFGVLFGDVFGGKNLSKWVLVICLIFIVFPMVFKAFLRLGGSYVGSISVLFAHRFLHRF